MKKEILIFLYIVSIFTPGFSQNLVSITNFGTNPGNLNMYIYVPANVANPCAIVTAIHGCSQSAEIYATSSGWNKIADEYGCIIIYPEQNYLNNYSYCFNWFLTADQEKGSGEALSVKEMVDYVKSNYTVDNSRVFCTGLSAGAAMTNVMLATYPEVFSAGAVMAGTPYKSGTDATTAYYAMLGTINKTPEEWKSLVVSQNPSFSGNFPRVAVFHGLSDNTVSPNNINEITEQWTAVQNADATADITETSFQGNSDVSRDIFQNASNDTVVITYKISNMGHAISVDPGTCETQGGATQLYAVDKNFHSTYWAARFFNIIPEHPIVGPGVTAINQAGLVFSVYNNSGSVYTWVVPAGAVIVTGQGTSQIVVNWGSSSGYVKVIETNVSSCTLPERKLYVNVNTGLAPENDLTGNVKLIQDRDNEYYIVFNQIPAEHLNISVYDLSGKIVFDQALEENILKQKINTKQLSAGLYYYTLTGESGNYKTGKLIINNK